MSYIGNAPGTTLTADSTTTLTNKTIALGSNTVSGTKAQFDTAVTDGNFVYVADIGTSVQAYDADLTTWAGVTPGTGVTTFLATPTFANLNSAISDADVGYINAPQNAQSGATYTLVLGDAGKHVYITSTLTLTVPTNASVAFPVGTTVTIVNNAAAVTTFTTTSLTVYKAGTSAAWASGGTLSIRGMCTWVKVDTDTWFVNGTTLS